MFPQLSTKNPTRNSSSIQSQSNQNDLFNPPALSPTSLLAFRFGLFRYHRIPTMGPGQALMWGISAKPLNTPQYGLGAQSGLERPAEGGRQENKEQKTTFGVVWSKDEKMGSIWKHQFGILNLKDPNQKPATQRPFQLSQKCQTPKGTSD